MAGFLKRFSKSIQTHIPDPKSGVGVGTVLNQRYQLDEEIGRGGMGIVYRAQDLQVQRVVALKIINLNTANDLSLGQFKREMDILSKLDHPHIVSFFDAGFVSNDESVPFFVMEWIKGEPLNEIGSLTFARVIGISKQICEALAAIHEKGFVYRDLKPGNILLEKRGFDYFVKLLDFGLVRPRGEAYLPTESNLAGTVLYLAPELIAGEPANVTSDLYALGVLLYEMITGRVPFSNIDEQTILAQHLEEKASPPSQSRSDVPHELESITMRLLEKDSRNRFSSAHEVLHALQKIQPEKFLVGNLPLIQTQKREHDTDEVVRLLESSSFVTLLNNDEDLAYSVGSQLAGEFPDGVWLLALEDIHDPAMVLITVISTLGVPNDPERPLAVSMVAYLREKRLLLILNRCGHLVNACAQLVSTLLDACPDVRILAVSERALNIPAEMCYPGG